MLIPTRMRHIEQRGNRARGQLGAERRWPDGRREGRDRQAKQQAIAVFDQDVLRPGAFGRRARGDPEPPPEQGVARVPDGDFLPNLSA
jgi:hypothetical protein